MTSKAFRLLFLFTFILFAVGVVLGRLLAPCSGVEVKKEITDTIRYCVPVAKDSTVIRYISVRLPPKPPKTEKFDDRDSNVIEAGVMDSVQVELPITQKVYEDSIYRAYISGYNPNLDSIIIIPPTIVKKRRWNIGLQIGYGMTIEQRPNFTPYVGIGLTYSLIK